ALCLWGRCRQHRFRDIELEGEEPLSERLPLVIHAERERPAAAEGVAEKEVERPQARELVALDGALAERREVASHALGVERPTKEGIGQRRASRDADVRMIALVARTRIGDAPERDPPTGTVGHREALAKAAGRRRRRSARDAGGAGRQLARHPRLT